MHVILASLVTGALVMLAVSAWQIRKRTRGRGVPPLAARIAVIVLLPVIVLQLFVGNKLGEIETKYQPIKIAAAEAQWEDCQPCSFSAFQIGGGKNDHTPSQIIEIPHLLSVLATGTFNGGVVGLNQLQKEDERKYGPGNYVPDVFIQYWSMRIMAYIAIARRCCSRCGAAGCCIAARLERLEVVPAPVDVGGRDAVRDEHRRLDADRERAPAVDRAGPDEDDQRQLAVGQLRPTSGSAWSCSC